MAQNRPDIPTALKRAVLVEAGHRCAIPTCRQTPVELAHITPWSKVNEHTFDNLIALCPTCHTRFDRGEMDRKSMLQYKQNLEVLNGRYTDVERQILKLYAREFSSIGRNSPVALSMLNELFGAPGVGRTFAFEDMAIHYGMMWLVSNLIDDGIVEVLVKEWEANDVAPRDGIIQLTPKGFNMIMRMVAAEPI
ncbi:HNH endonuclease [Streptomyces sp. Agncl-13]|uniref:HNH endonuclease n=1 Tax=Streptomyces sp. Agncl-13 TaxID=3400628 RepID=UPI003A89CD57